MSIKKISHWPLVMLLVLIIAPAVGFAGTVSGELVKWHGVTVSFQGPLLDEMDSSPNPFLDYRLQVTFTAPSGNTYDVPGYFDGDGSGGGTGQVWRVRFAPDEPGTWAYQASFRTGNNVSVDLSPAAGVPDSFDGDAGNFTVADTDPAAEGFLKYGRLESIGEYYFKFRDGSYWIKGGMDSPENFLGYTGFDNTPYALHDYSTHVSDWSAGDPDWDSTNVAGSNDGRGIIGTLNYLASQNLNSIYFMPMNIGADGKDTWPYASTTIDRNGSPSNDNVHFDISKLQQWEIALDHAQRKSIFLHFVLSDREAANKNELDNATLGVERKLFYREMIARFGHNNALQWNISEEYNLHLPLDPAVIKVFAQYINDVDPYGHPVTVHNHGNTYVNALGPFVGDTRFGVMSVQTWQRPDDIGSAIEHFRTETASAGHIVPTAVDESIGVDQLSAANYRKRAIWDAMLSGGGHELFVRYQDSSLNDYSTFEDHYRYLWYARSFVQNYLPFWEMTPGDTLVTGENAVHGGAEVFAKEGEVYAIFLPAADIEGTLSLGGNSGQYEQRWFNPRTGQFAGSVQTIDATSSLGLGLPPSEVNEDWVTIVTAVNTANTLFIQSTAGQGLVSMEAESYHDKVAQGGHDWIVSIIGGQSGAAAMESSPNDGTTQDTGYVTGSPRLDYTIDFTEVGTHYVWIRGLGDSDGASVDDSVHVGLDGVAVNTSDRITGFNSSWSWTNTTMDRSSVARIDITTPGEHTVNVWMREDGLIIDKLVITTDASFDPVAAYGIEGPPESPQGLPGLSAPVIDPVAGAYFGMVTVSMTAEAGASIYYTTDGSVPTTSSTLYSGAFDLSSDATVQAIAVLSGRSDSPVASASYVISTDLQPPTISPAGGAYIDSVTVTMTAGAAGASVYYTTDDSVPTTSSFLYTGPFDLLSDATVRAITVMSGFSDSVEASEVYTITEAGAGSGLFLQSTAGQGLVSMEAESYHDKVAQGGHDWIVSIIGGQSGAAAMESSPNDGTTQDTGYVTGSPRLDYTIDFTEVGTHYVWIRGLGDSDGASVDDSVHVGLDGVAVNTSDRITGFNSSWSWTNTTMDRSSVARIDITTPGEHTVNVWMREDGLIIDKLVITTDASFDPVAAYGIEGPPESPQGLPGLSAPVIDPVAGAYFGMVTVSMTAEAGASIYYTTDGSVPTTSSTLYSGAFDLSSDATVQAIAVLSGRSDSPVASASYVISTDLQPPTISPAGGAYIDSVTVTMTAGAAGASVYYTTDDSVPTTSSFLYTGPFDLLSDATVRAITVMSGFSDSVEASEVYTITEAGAGSGLFLQSTAGQGLVSMEAESYHDKVAQGGHDWIVSIIGGQSGAAAMESSPNDGTTQDTGYVTGSPRLDYTIDFTEVGTHYVWIRGLGDSDGASVDDSVHVGLDGVAVNTSDRITGFNSSWSWTNTTMDRSSVARIDITTPGEHTVNVWMREDGLIIDKLVITTDASFDPVAAYGIEGPPESPQGLPGLSAPVIDPVAGAYFGMVTVSMTAEAGASIYYTTDGSVPTTSSTLYSGAFDLSSDATVQAIAVLSGRSDSPVASASYVISTDLQPPTISPAGGAYIDSVTVTMTAGAAGASVYYTTDDSVPTTSSFLYTGPFDLLSDATVRAITVMSGFSDSVEASEVYTITEAGAGSGLFLQSTAGQGLVSMEAESYHDKVAQGGHDWIVSIIGGQSGAAAMESSPNDGTTQDTGYVTGSPRLDYTIDFTEVGTHYVWIRGLGDSDGASVDDSVHVGLDGVAVNTSDRITGFNSSWSWTNTTMDRSSVARIDITTPGEHTVNVWMREDGLIIDKLVITTDASFDPVAAYGIEGPPESPQGLPGLSAPVIDPVAGAYFGMVTVSMTAEAGASIYYTTDGSVPTTSSTLYSGAFDLSSDATVQAIAVLSGRSDSPVASASYVISTDLQPPTISPAGGAYIDSVTVTMTAGAAGASVYYTTDDSVPTTSSFLYTGPFDLLSDATVRAITVMSGFSDSVEASEVYTITEAGAGSGLFLQSTAGQGLVSMEAESYHDKVAQGGHDWIVSIIGGQSGAAAMESSPNDGTTLNTGYETGSPRLDYVIDFAETGTHYVWIRGLGDSDGASVDDSVHVGLDGVSVSTSDRITGFNSSWSWTNTTMDSGAVARFEITTPGVHTVNVWMREDGLIIDKLVITTDASFDPVAAYGIEGPPESPQGLGTLSPPVISPDGGTFFTNRTVSITVTSGDIIRYTTDGSDPDETSPQYLAPFVVSSDTTVKAYVSSSSGLLPDSSIKTATFTSTLCADTRVMPLGDSITLGKDANGAPDVGYRVSYRRELFFDLVEAGFNIDFVGSMDEGELAVPVFDSNHEGHAGFTDDQVGANVYQWLSNNPADVVLLHIGTNNPETSAADVDFILSEIDRFSTDVEVVLAKIINTQSYNPTVSTFNNNLESIALSRIAAGDKITIVDMESAVIAPDDFTDNLHPNVSGYTNMSEVWFNALSGGVLPVCTP